MKHVLLERVCLSGTHTCLPSCLLSSDLRAVENDGQSDPAVDHIPSLTDLLLSQVPVNLRDQEGWTALAAAAKKGKANAAKRLLVRSEQCVL